MTNDKKIKDDDFDLDDFDLDDLDDLEDDLENDEFSDDLEDGFDSDGFEDDFDDGSAKKSALRAGRKSGNSDTGERSFLQKNFWFVVGGVILLVLLLILLGSGGDKKPAVQNLETQQTQSVVESAEDVVVSESIVEDSQQNGQTATIDITPNTQTDSTMLPMPTPINTFDGGDNNQVMSDSTSENVGEDDIFSLLPAQPTKAPVRNNIILLPNVDDEMQRDPNVLNLEINDTSEETRKMLDAPGMNLANVPKKAISDEDLAVVKESNVLVNTVTKDVSGVKSELQILSKDLTGKIESTDEKLERLLKSVESLEQRVSALSKAGVQSVSTPTKATQKEAPVVVGKTLKDVLPMPSSAAPKATTSSKTVVKKSQPRIRKAAASRWELRSAQPGKAVVVRKGTSDFKTVEVGGSLSGIGKITSITFDNGKWVVRGTTGRLSH